MIPFQIFDKQDNKNRCKNTKMNIKMINHDINNIHQRNFTKKRI